MGKKRMRWELAGAAFVLVAGVLLHFVYQWSGENGVVAAFSAVNESVWEHMKLVFVPLFVWTMVELFFLGRDYPGFLAVRGVTTLLGTALVPILFYTYTGILGRHYLWADIAVFVLAVLAAFWADERLLRGGRLSSGWMQVAGLAVLWAMAFLFVLWTYRPPHLPLFQDALTLAYGVTR